MNKSYSGIAQPGFEGLANFQSAGIEIFRDFLCSHSLFFIFLNLMGKIHYIVLHIRGCSNNIQGGYLI
jgi:hypothetical protein